MDIVHSPRHTRRGFLRGDSAPKFFPVVSLQSPPLSPPTSEPVPSLGAPVTPLASLPFPPPPHENRGPAPSSAASLSVSSRNARLRLGCEELLADLEKAARASEGNAFLSWLAEQLSDEASREQLLETVEDAVEEDHRDLEIDLQIGDASDWFPDSLKETFDLSFSGGAAFDSAADEDGCRLMGLFSRVRKSPAVELAADGWRCERYGGSSKIIKDALGRVVEVYSQFGEAAYFRYGVLGKLEHFERTDRLGRPHSEGRKDKHGVVVRDSEGRVRAAGESMVVDPRGCFYVHTVDGQYMSLDLVTGIHSERRKVANANGSVGVVTSLFAHDGFRMATIFSGAFCSGDSAEEVETAEDTQLQELRFRFYGRDGTLIEFASEEDLRSLQPLRVLPPAFRKIDKSWQRKRQAGTAWDSVHEYLMRVS